MTQIHLRWPDGSVETVEVDTSTWRGWYGNMEEVKQPTLIPMPGRIVVEALKDEMTPSGLFLPTNSLAEQRATVGKVIALPAPFEVDEDTYSAFLEIEIKIGDVVLFGINSGMNVDVGYGQARRRAVILREGEILCKVVDGEGKPYA